jgi:hypothetical protein
MMGMYICVPDCSKKEHVPESRTRKPAFKLFSVVPGRALRRRLAFSLGLMIHDAAGQESAWRLSMGQPLGEMLPSRKRMAHLRLCQWPRVASCELPRQIGMARLARACIRDPKGARLVRPAMAGPMQGPHRSRARLPARLAWRRPREGGDACGEAATNSRASTKGVLLLPAMPRARPRDYWIERDLSTR